MVEVNQIDLIRISPSAAQALNNLDISAKEGPQTIRVYFQGFG